MERDRDRDKGRAVDSKGGTWEEINDGWLSSIEPIGIRSNN